MPTLVHFLAVAPQQVRFAQKTNHATWLKVVNHDQRISFRDIENSHRLLGIHCGQQHLVRGLQQVSDALCSRDFKMCL